MSISPVEDILAEPEFPPDDPKPVRKKGRRRSTSHLKAVPETLEERTRVKDAAEEYALTLDSSRAFSKGEQP